MQRKTVSAKDEKNHQQLIIAILAQPPQMRFASNALQRTVRTRCAATMQSNTDGIIPMWFASSKLQKTIELLRVYVRKKRKPFPWPKICSKTRIMAPNLKKVRSWNLEKRICGRKTEIAKNEEKQKQLILATLPQPRRWSGNSELRKKKTYARACNREQHWRSHSVANLKQRAGKDNRSTRQQHEATLMQPLHCEVEETSLKKQ